MSTVIIKLDKMDWALLRVQKTQLIDIASLEPEAEEMSEGLLGLLDEIMDQAAEQIGEETVFGKTDKDGFYCPEPPYDPVADEALIHKYDKFCSKPKK